MTGTENLGIDFDDIDEEKQEELAVKMLVYDTVVAFAAGPKSFEPYLIKITEENKDKMEDV